MEYIWSTTEYHRVPWSTMEYHGVPLEYHNAERRVRTEANMDAGVRAPASPLRSGALPLRRRCAEDSGCSAAFVGRRLDAVHRRMTG